jgi:hypothetical protein
MPRCLPAKSNEAAVSTRPSRNRGWARFAQRYQDVTFVNAAAGSLAMGFEVRYARLMRSRFFFACVLAILGCDESSSTSPDAAGGTAGNTGVGATSGSMSGTMSMSTGTGAGPQKPEDVPAEPLGGDPTVVCPAAFKSTKPTEGDNSGFDVAGQSRTFAGRRPLLIAFNGTGETDRSTSAELRRIDSMSYGTHPNS